MAILLLRSSEATQLQVIKSEPTKKAPSFSATSSYAWLVPLIVTMIAWELSVRIGLFSTDRLPLFSSVLMAGILSLNDPGFLMCVSKTFASLALGIVVSVIVALPLALMAGFNNLYDSALTPTIMLAGALPDLAILPVLLVWVGSGNIAPVAIAAISSFFPVYFTVREGMKEIPGEYFHVAKVFRSPKCAVLCKVIFPSILPFLVTGLRLSFDFAWEVVLAVEIISRVSGIGTYINTSAASGSIDAAFAGVLVVGVLALAVDRLGFAPFDRKFGRWRD